MVVNRPSLGSDFSDPVLVIIKQPVPNVTLDIPESNNIGRLTLLVDLPPRLLWVLSTKPLFFCITILGRAIQTLAEEPWYIEIFGKGLHPIQV